MAMNQITDNIYIGSLLAVSAVETLKRKKITYILSVLTKELAPKLDPAVFKQLVIDIDDIEDENIMQYFETTNAFIQEAIENGKSVLVHCQAGISRSVTVACAYIMKDQKISVEDVLKLVASKRSVANPNPSFLKQLQIYYECNYDVSTSKPPYRQWLLANEAEKASLAGAAPEDITYTSATPSAESLEATETTTTSKLQGGVENTPTLVKCKKCRTTLASSDSFIYHEPKNKDPPAMNFAPRNGLLFASNIGHSCMHYFIEPVAWMKPELEQGKVEGKLLCPKCQCRVGSYRWQGLSCSCGTWVTPAIQLQRSKVDEQPLPRRSKPSQSEL